MESLAERVLEPMRRELTSYLGRLVLRPGVAEELTQTAFLRALESADRIPAEPARARAWIFRVATHLAIDELRRQSTRREVAMQDLREAAEADPGFLQRSRDLVGTPETKSIAREHLTACFACVLRKLPEHRAAAVLLREINGFSVEESAEILGASPAQVKNWLQEGRAVLSAAYADTCALVRKDGVCHQCIELDGFMRAGEGSPSADAPLSWEARLDIVRRHPGGPWGTWHRMLFELLESMD